MIGVEGVEPAVGALTLEDLGLKVDPCTGKLEPTRSPGVYYLIGAWWVEGV